MLDVVATQKKKLPLPVEIVDVDDAEPRLPAAAAAILPGIIRRPPVSLRKTTPNSTTRTRMIANAMTYWTARDASIPKRDDTMNSQAFAGLCRPVLCWFVPH